MKRGIGFSLFQLGKREPYGYKNALLGWERGLIPLLSMQPAGCTVSLIQDYRSITGAQELEI